MSERLCSHQPAGGVRWSHWLADGQVCQTCNVPGVGNVLVDDQGNVCGALHPRAGVYCNRHDDAAGHVATDEFGGVLRRWLDAAAELSAPDPDPEPYVTPGHPVKAGAGYDCACGECLARRHAMEDK